MVSESVKVIMDAEKAAAVAVEKAREDAKTIISDARADGERIIAEAKKQAQAEAEIKFAAAKQRTDEIAARGAKDAAADVAALKNAVEGKISAAKEAALKVFME